MILNDDFVNQKMGSPKHVVLKATRGGRRSTASPTR